MLPYRERKCSINIWRAMYLRQNRFAMSLFQYSSSTENKKMGRLENKDCLKEAGGILRGRNEVVIQKR